MIVSDTCAWHVRMDDVDHDHHSGLAVAEVMPYVVTSFHFCPDRQADRVALDPSRGSQTAFPPLPSSPNKHDKSCEEDHPIPMVGLLKVCYSYQRVIRI